jgi:hypothetical protein
VPERATDPAPDLVPALVAEAARKSRICWLSYEHAGTAHTERLVWHAWYDDALVVLSGDAGQVLDGIGEVDRAEVTLRAKDGGTRLVTWTGEVTRVDPVSEEWEGHAGALLGVRLNLADPQEALERWRTDATVVRISPVPAPDP